MKKFISIILTIITTATAFLTIIVFAIGMIFSTKTTQKIVKNADVTEIVEEIKEDGDLDPLYEEAQKYDIPEEKVDEVLSSDEAKEYYNALMQKYLNGELNNVSKETQKLIDEATERYDIKINEEQKEELNEKINDTIVGKSKTIKIDAPVANVKISDYAEMLNGKVLKIVLLILLAIENIILIIINWQKKNYMSYIATIFLFAAILTGLFTFIFQAVLAFGNNTLEQTIGNLVTLFKPILNKGYITALILFIISILSYILNSQLTKQSRNISQT